MNRVGQNPMAPLSTEIALKKALWGSPCNQVELVLGKWTRSTPVFASLLLQYHEWSLKNPATKTRVSSDEGIHAYRWKVLN